jgi:hypothetical protein
MKKCTAGVSLLVFVWMSASDPLYATGDTNEVWISARGNQPGTGVILGSGEITNPFHGDFEAIINSLETNTTIHLLPGIHDAGEVALKSNQKLRGAGIDVTIVRRDPRRHGDMQVDGLIWSRGDGVEVSDLTVDSNANGTELNKKNAFYLIGSHCAVRWVKAIHNTGNLARGQECFPFFIGWTNSVGNEVSECEVSSVAGSYCTAIFLAGQGVVKFNRVFLPPFTNVDSIYTAYQASGTRDALFLGNTSDGGRYGFETDTSSETNLTIADNYFHNVCAGIVIAKGPGQGWGVDGVSIINNVIEISTNIPAWTGNWTYGVMIRDGDKTGRDVYQRIAVVGNTLRYCNNGGIGTQAGTVGIVVTAAVPTNSNVVNVRILGNTMDRSFATRLNGQGNWLADNVDLRGVPLHLVQLGDGSPDTVSLQVTDGLVMVTATNTTSILLPPSSGFSGKEVTVVNQKKRKLRIFPATGERILPSSPTTLRQSQVARFVSNGSGTWIRE